MNSQLLFLLFISITFITLTFASNNNLPDDDYNDDPYNPTSRDFTARCNDIAEYAGPNACKAFMKCCSEDFSLNKLNGDRCQVPDSNNACTLKVDSSGIQYSQCKAHNCTAEITTTTTTTRRPLAVHSSSSAVMSVGSILLAAALSLF
jgi:hypothetical protein